VRGEATGFVVSLAITCGAVTGLRADNVLPQNTAAASSVGFFVIRSGLFGSTPSGSFYIGIDLLLLLQKNCFYS
jgi:hypothetical protein